MRYIVFISGINLFFGESSNPDKIERLVATLAAKKNNCQYKIYLSSELRIKHSIRML